MLEFLSAVFLLKNTFKNLFLPFQRTKQLKKHPPTMADLNQEEDCVMELGRDSFPAECEEELFSPEVYVVVPCLLLLIMVIVLLCWCIHRGIIQIEGTYELRAFSRIFC